MIDKTLSLCRILEKLGQGGMGRVHRAEDKNLSRRAAIKVLPSIFAGDAHGWPGQHECRRRREDAMPHNRPVGWLPAKIIFSLFALFMFVLVGFGVFRWVPEGRRDREKMLKAPNISSKEDLIYPVGTEVSATGLLHKEGATPGDYIVYVKGHFEPGQRGKRYVVESVARPSALELRIEDAGVKLAASVEKYSWMSTSESKSYDGTMTTTGFTEGQEVTCFGVLRSLGTGQDPPTIAFREIHGESWLVMEKRLREAEGRIPMRIAILVLIGLLFVGLVVFCFIAERRAQRSTQVP